MRRRTTLKIASQQGVALFLSLVMLLLLTILGVSSVQTTSMQERMARNARDTNLAFQSAEAALRDGEDWIETNLISLAPFEAGGAEAGGLYYENDFDETSNWRAIDWDNDQACGSSTAPTGTRWGDTTVPGVCVQPKYIVEHVKTVISDQDLLNLDNIGQDTGAGRAQIFRITSYGTGGSATAHVMIQATYGKRF
ncbi:MAG: PilX N-terminal domain-containing pilus assembly protein [Pseudomonadota bacterium]